MHLSSFPAQKGDSFVLRWRGASSDEYIIIDAGSPGAYQYIKPYLIGHGLPHAVFVTHVDYDHVGGFIKMFNDTSINNKNCIAVYLNTPELILAPPSGDDISVAHGATFANILEQAGIIPFPLYLGFYPKDQLDIAGLKLDLFSPSKVVVEKLMKEWAADVLHEKLQAERTPPAEVSVRRPDKISYEDILKESEDIPRWQDDLDNSASIAFLGTDSRHKVLLLADSNPTLICQALRVKGFSETNKLKVNLVKLSHHGCRYNTSVELLRMLDCKYFYISTNGVGPYYHPHRETIVRICEFSRKSRAERLHFFLNYPLDTTEFVTWSEMKDWNISITYKPELDLEECL